MKKYIITLLIMSALQLVGCQNTSPRKETGIKATLKESIDTYLTTNISAESAGVAVLITQDQQVLYSSQSGMANTHSQQAITHDTGFRIGSISKPFTALAVMQLYEQGLLTLDDALLDYIPELPTSWHAITLHHLLTHQSGIPDFGNDMNIVDDWPDGVTNTDIVNFFEKNGTLEFEPGSYGDYSNTGYVLLAEIISRISGLRFSDYMQQHIFSPLNMQHSYIADEYSTALDNHALNFAEFTTVFGNDFYISGSSGIISSINDMNKFMEAFLRGDIVSLQTIELMRQNHTKDWPSPSDYGYGFYVDPEEIRDSLAHAGGNDSFRSLMIMNRDTNAQLIILGNEGHQTIDYNYIIELVGAFGPQPE